MASQQNKLIIDQIKYFHFNVDIKNVWYYMIQIAMLSKVFKDQRSLGWRRLASDWSQLGCLISSKFIGTGHFLKKRKKRKRKEWHFSLFQTDLAVRLNTAEHCSSPWGNVSSINAWTSRKCTVITLLNWHYQKKERFVLSPYKFFWMDLLLPNYLQYIGSFSIRYINNPVDLKKHST